jgi:hypothetical protein
MNTSLRLEQLISIRGRFHRSVNLMHDWNGAAELGEYVVTPTAREFAEQVLDELGRDKGTRAWSVTGPYGTGKSALALFLADVLAAKRPMHAESIRLRAVHASRWQAPFAPVLAVAERRPLEETLIEAFARGMQSAGLKRIATRFRREAGEGALVEAMLSAVEAAGQRGHGGVVIVLDEMGKFLEYAADNDLDLFLLQQIAEAAARSTVPFLFITILHTGFADYLPVADDRRRIEWEKVQGRFRDVPYHLPAEQLLALVGHSLQKSWSPAVEAEWGDAIDEVLWKGNVFEESAQRMDLRTLLHACYPFHPVAALLLAPLFRSKLAQNERSLFAFLTSYEPFGFREFLQGDVRNGKGLASFDPPRLYDYVSNALGISAFRGEHARRWSLIEYALTRLPTDAPPKSAELIKAVGLVGMYGSTVGLRPSPDLLRLIAGPDANAALSYLEDRSVLLYRRHSDAYALWEGSDIDLDVAFVEAAQHVGRGPIADRLRRALRMRPIVARAHYIETGTLRLFEVSLVDASVPAIRVALEQASEADGRILFVVGAVDDEEEQLIEHVRPWTQKHECGSTIIGFPHSSNALEEALRELEGWQWVRDHTPALSGDPVARQEVVSRIAAAQERFERFAGELFGLPGYHFNPGQTTWVYAGEQELKATAIAFQQWLSSICTKEYYCAPPLRNELVNRASLSSATSAARRNLIEWMLTRADTARLGIEGNPPEASIYASVLQVSGIHAKRRRRWSVDRPLDPAWQPVWDEICAFFSRATGEREPILRLYERLRQAPYGMREGPIALLVCAALIVKRHEIALYEDGGFVTSFRVEVLERLLRRPDTFAVQSLNLSEVQRRAVQELRRLMTVHRPSRSIESGGLIPVLRALVLTVAQMNPYTRRTMRVGPKVAEVRRELLRAEDPRKLLFGDLPRILDITVGNPKDAHEFAQRLFASFETLHGAYPALLEEIGVQVREAFQLSGSEGQVWDKLRVRAAPLQYYATDRRLKVLIAELLNNRREEERRWEAIGRAVRNGTPPSHWADADVQQFGVEVQEVALEFLRLEQLAAEKERSGAQRVIRIDVLGGAGSGPLVISVPSEPDIEREIYEMAARIRELMAPISAVDGNGRLQRIRLAALAEVAAGVMATHDQGN